MNRPNPTRPASPGGDFMNHPNPGIHSTRRIHRRPVEHPSEVIS